MKTNYLLLLVLVTLFEACSQRQYLHPTVKIKTHYGNILVELYPKKAPQTVAAFLSYVDSGYYQSSSFYRVLKEEDQPSSSEKTELIQGGIYRAKPQLVPGREGIPLETTRETGLSHIDGTISLARTTPNSGSTEFFIVVGDQTAYDYGGGASTDGQGYAAFGRVIEGMEVVRNIHEAASYGDQFRPPIPIQDIALISKGSENVQSR